MSLERKANACIVKSFDFLAEILPHFKEYEVRPFLVSLCWIFWRQDVSESSRSSASQPFQFLHYSTTVNLITEVWDFDGDDDSYYLKLRLNVKVY
jgi:hypothetical protein